MRNAVILAAGKGTRMKSEMSKVMHPILDRPMLAYIVDACHKAGAERIVIIAGYQADALKAAFPEMEFAIQEPQLGSGHAAMQAEMLRGEQGTTLVINGDGPCIRPETLKALYGAAEKSGSALMTAVLEDGAHYGRILRDTSGVIGIQEAKDCTPEQLEIKEINAGMYCFDNELLFEGLDALTNDNAQHEYYITDLVKIFHDRGIATAAIAADREEMMGINDPLELAAAAKVISGRINAEHMRNGVQLCVPEQIFIGPDVKIGHDVIIEPNVILYGSTVVEPYVQIKSGSRLENAHIHAGAVIDASHIRNTEIQENEKIGPYASVGEE